MSICLKDTLYLYLDVPASCYQWSDTTITLNRVYRSQPYWNSGPVLTFNLCSGGTDQVQFHFYCEYEPSGGQQFRLRWYDPWTGAAQTRQCSALAGGSANYEWTWVSSSCDPFSHEFTRTTTSGHHACFDAPTNCPGPDDPKPDHVFTATVTE